MITMFFQVNLGLSNSPFLRHKRASSASKDQNYSRNYTAAQLVERE